MPELPDVEGFRRRLERHGRRGRIKDVDVIDAGVVRNADGAGFRRALVGHRFRSPQRRGKWLVAPTDGPVLLMHFGMTGSLEWDAEPHRHDRMVLRLDGHELRYRDQRKLQGLWLADDDEEAARIIGRQGPDAWGITRAQLEERLSGKRTGLKAALMDQAVIAGLGNIVTDEVLWRARLNPQRRPSSLNADEWGRLHRSLRRVLKDSIEAGHVPAERSWLTSRRTEPDPACPRCRRPLQRTRSGGRTTLWCPACQPERP
ncbi:MAG: DNA-formamidopyrimidine glycosylase family protein [Actinomycetota bacterium]|jgi:formamidopyrimidine-DNA glycosylase